jgi:1-acyl-sn-glycerol-3-phosphate acyltransferase
MKARYPIVVVRKDAKEDFKTVMEQGKELLAKGISVIIFPQSTRMTEFDPSLFNSLGIKLAIAAGVKVIPVAIKTDFWGNGKWVKDIGPVNRDNPIFMTFGKPMEINGNGKEEHKQILEFITHTLRQWGGRIK